MVTTKFNDFVGHFTPGRKEEYMKRHELEEAVPGDLKEERSDGKEYGGFIVSEVTKEPNKTTLDFIIMEVLAELARATAEFGPFHSAHEGHSVVREEFDELWDEVKLKLQDKNLMRHEATQLAAMSIRFIMDCCQETLFESYNEREE